MTHTFPSREGVTVVLHDVPTTVGSETGEVIGFRIDVSRATAHLVQEAARDRAPGATVKRQSGSLRPARNRASPRRTR